MGDLTGKIAVVTGAGKGIGAAIAARFLKDNIKGLVLLDYDKTLVEETAKNLDPDLKRVLAVVCDVSKQDQVHNAVAEALARFGTIDILVNNAGITRDRMFHKMEKADWDAVLDINLNGPFYFCKEIFPVMREKKYGRIVNVSSVSAFGNAGQTNYSTSKSALLGFTKTLAKEGGPKNITVNCIAPGYINTDMISTVPKEILAANIATLPLMRLGDPSEVAGVVSFLSSDDSSYVSGQCLIVSGGANT